MCVIRKRLYAHPVYFRLLTCNISQETEFITLAEALNPQKRANRSSASQEISGNLWSPKDHYRIRKYPPPEPIRSQINPFHSRPSHVLKIHSNIILPSTYSCYQCSPFLGYPHQNPVCSCPSVVPHALPISFFLIFIIRMLFGKECKAQRSTG
jgi:hypothetical protein